MNGTVVMQELTSYKGLAFILRTNGREGFGFAVYPDRRIVELFDVSSEGEWINLSRLNAS